MKSLLIMSNFLIQADVNDDHYFMNLMKPLIAYGEPQQNTGRIDSYKITPKSFWNGMQYLPEVDFIQILKDNAKQEIAPAFISQLKKFKSRFGIITMVGDDCLKVKDKDVLKEIKNNTKLNEMIYEYEDNLIFFKGDINTLHEIMQREIFCPIYFRRSKMTTFLITHSGYKNFVVNAEDTLPALRLLYNKHKDITEEDLRNKLKYKKEEVTEEAITSYLEIILKDYLDKAHENKSKMTIYKIPEYYKYELVGIEE